jgi:molecular chaperone Hsp33
VRKEDWSRSMTLLGTMKDSEILDPALHSRELLLRLFHEEGVRVYKPLHVTKGCRCDSEKIEKVLASLADDDIEYLSESGTIQMHCEFCSRDFTLDPDTVKNRTKKKKPKKK